MLLCYCMHACGMSHGAMHAGSPLVPNLMQMWAWVVCAGLIRNMLMLGARRWRRELKCQC